MHLSTSLIILVGLASCGKVSKNKFLQSQGEMQLSLPYFVSNLSPNVARPGDTIVVRGAGFTSDMALTIEGSSLKAEISSLEEMSFTLPAGQPGVVVVTVGKSTGESQHTLVRLPEEEGALLVASGVASDFCQNQKVYLLSGGEFTGAKACSASAKPCSADGEEGCLATNAYPAIHKAGIDPSKISDGAQILGIPGTAPVYPECMEDGTGCVIPSPSAMRAVTVTNLVPTNIKYGVTIGNTMGTYAPPCSGDGDGACFVDNMNFKAADVSGITGADLVQGASIAGITGTLDLSNLVSGNVRKGVSINGISGNYETPACAGDGESNCRVVPPLKAANTEAFSATDIRKGKTVGGVQGEIKFCTNAASPNYNFEGFSDFGFPESLGWDIYDNIVDYDGSIYAKIPVVPGGEICDKTNWEDKTADGTCDSTADSCVFKDSLTQLYWSEQIPGRFLMKDAISMCDAAEIEVRDVDILKHWRVPTQKELLQAYIDGIWDLGEPFLSPTDLSGSDRFWSTTTNPLDTFTGADPPLAAFVLSFFAGNSTFGNKATAARNVICVHGTP